jgi:hypothetical protein
MIKHFYAGLIGLLIAQQAFAGLPPTTAKGQNGASSTTFNFQAPRFQSTKINATTALLETGNQNELKNPGFEASTGTAPDDWSVSTGALTYTAIDAASGAKSAVFSPAGSGEVMSSYAITITSGAGLSGNSGAASCRIKTVSGSANPPTIQAYDGTNILASTAVAATTSTYTRTTVNFPFPASGTTSLRIVSTGAGSYKIDDCYLGLAEGFNLATVAGGIITEWVAYTPTITGFGTPTSVSFYSRRIGDSLEVEGSFIAGTVAASVASISFGYNGNNANVTMDTSKLSANGVVGRGMTNASATTTYFGNITVIGNSGSTVLLGYRSSTAVESSGANGNAIIGTGNFLSVRFMVPISGWTANFSGSAVSADQTVEYVYNSDTSNADNLTAFAYGDTGGQFGSYATAARTKRVRFTQGIQSVDKLELEIKQNGSWIPIGSNNLLVANATTTTQGMYIQPVSGVSTDVDVVFGTTRDVGGNSWSGIAGTDNFKWRLKKIKNGLSAPLLVGSVTSNSSGLERAEHAHVSSTGTVSGESGDWVNGNASIASNVFTITLNSGMFSSAPVCLCTPESSSALYLKQCQATSATSVSVLWTQTDNAANGVKDFGLFCVGPR